MHFLFISFIPLFSGCSSKYDIPDADLKIVDAEKNSLIKQWEQYPNESRYKMFYKIIKDDYGFVQPSNKKQTCRMPKIIYHGFTDSNHDYFWDGNCKDGYAEGLGRGIAKSTYQVTVLYLQNFFIGSEIMLTITRNTVLISLQERTELQQQK